MKLKHWVERRARMILVLLIILAIGLRLINIGRDSLWFDEAISYLASTLPIPEILNNSIQSSHPPAYYLMLRLWRQLVPDSDPALKLLSVFWNVLLVPIIYLLTKTLLNQKWLALLTAGLVSISPFHILYSHELRMYTQVMLLVTLAAWAYWQARQCVQWRWWALFGLFALAAVYTHLFAFLVLAGIGLHALIHHQERQLFWRTCLIIGLISLLFVPWLGLMLSEAQKDLGSLRPLAQESGRNPIKPLTSLAFLLFGMSSNLIFTGLILFTIVAIGAILLIDARKIRRQRIPDGILLTGLIIVSVLGLPLMVYLVRPFFLPERTMAVASPFLLLFLAWLTTLKHSPLPYLVGFAAVLMIVGTILYHTGPLIKPPYREATNWVSEQIRETDLVLHTSDGSYLPALRYAQLSHHAVLAGDPDPRKPVEVYEAVGGNVWRLDDLEALPGERLWLIVALEHSLEWQQAQTHYFASTYALLEEHEIGGIQIFLYAK